MFQVNGKITKIIDIQDRAVQYGDGVFETIVVKDRKIEFWKYHFQRLSKGCTSLKIKSPAENLLIKEINKLIKKTKARKFILKIIVSRGKGGRGYNPPKKSNPTRILGIYNWPEYPKKNYTKGIKVNVCKTRISLQPSLSTIKHLNRLEQILARSEWQSNDISESIMLDTENNVVECTMSNIFGVKNKTFYTPNLSLAGVEGVMRCVILKILNNKKQKYFIKKIPLKEFLKFDEIFVCNSVFGIWPVIKIGKKNFFYGEETKKLIDILSTIKKN